MIPARGQLVLGTATLGLNGTREEAFALLDAFVELGGSIIDTAAPTSKSAPAAPAGNLLDQLKQMQDQKGAAPQAPAPGEPAPAAPAPAPAQEPPK